MEWLVDLLTTTSTGGIIGVLGSWLTKREERKNLQLKYDHDLKMSEIRKEEAKIEAEHELAMADKQVERAQVEGELAIGEVEMKAFTEGLKEQSKTYGIRLVDSVRGLMRPLITVYLLVIATFIMIQIHNLVGGFDTVICGPNSVESCNPDTAINTYKSVIDQVLFLTATAVTWWFGSRPSSQRKDK